VARPVIGVYSMSFAGTGHRRPALGWLADRFASP